MKHEEEKIQAEIVRYLQSEKIYCHSVPNELAGEGRQAKIRMGRFISMGLRKGVADLVVWLPSGIVYMEVKTPTGRQSENQKNFQKRCKHYGVPYHLVRSVGDVACIVDKSKKED